MMTTKKTLVALAILGLVTFGAAGPAAAEVSVFFGLPGLPYVVAPPPVVYAPPVYYGRPYAYYGRPYYGRAYYGRPYWGGGWHRGWYKHGRW